MALHGHHTYSSSKSHVISAEMVSQLASKNGFRDTALFAPSNMKLQAMLNLVRQPAFNWAAYSFNSSCDGFVGQQITAGT